MKLLADWNLMLPKIKNQVGPWAQHFEIFDKFGFESELIVIINLFRVNDQDHIYFGSVIKFLCNPHVNYLFSEWACECLVAQRLSQLSDFLIINKINQKFPASNQLKPVKQLLHGRLLEKSLLAIILERLPLTDRCGKEWYLTLSTWLLVRAFRCAYAGNYNDEYLSTVFSRLRMAADNDELSLSVIRELIPASIGLYEIETQLIGSTARLIKRGGHSSAILLFLRSLERIAKGEQKPNKENSHATNFIHAKPIPSTIHFMAPEISAINSSTGEFAESEEGYLEGMYDSETPNHTFSHQHLEGYAVLLNSVVNSQYLLFELNSATEAELETLNHCIENLLVSSSQEARALAAFVWISMQTSRTLQRGIEIAIDTVPQSEWTLNPNDCNLYRTPPHRSSDWRPSDPEQSRWIKPYANAITIQLPEVIKEVLSSESGLIQNSSKLADIWARDWMPIEKAFQQHFASFDHLTPGGLARLYPQYFLRKFPDESVAQLISSHPQSGLNASCAYANFTNGDVERLQKQHFLFFLPDGVSFSGENTRDSILFGSVLDAVDELLKIAIDELNKHYVAYCESANEIDRHNAITTYLLLMLYSAVGGRPIADPFESVLHFDFENCFLYLDDKVVKGDSTGRLVPIPAVLSKFIEKQYLTHLRLLAHKFESKNSDLSQEILRMASFNPSGTMPFFFFLEDTENEIQWSRILPTSITGSKLFDCPLPLNLFRHRYAKQLRRESLDTEIIAGFLGHVESGCAPYSTYSHRCFMSDVEVARPLIERIFNDLPFKLNADFHRIKPFVVTDNRPIKFTQHAIDSSDVLFGEAARAKARERQISIWTEVVEADIHDLLEREHKSLTELDEATVEKLVVKMLSFDNGLPRHNRAFRYEYLCNRLEATFSETGQFIHFKKRYVSARIDSVFEEESAYSLSVFNHVKKRLRLSSIIQTPSRLNKCSALQLVPLLLLFETRLSDIEQIKRVVLKNQYRILVADDGHFLEVFNEESTSPNPLARRYKISPLCAYLLDRWGGKSQTVTFEEDLDASLMHLFTELTHVKFSSYTSLLDLLGKIVGQTNYIELTGIEAGFLSGRLESYGLHDSDWARLRYGRLLEFNQEAISNPLQAFDDADLLAVASDQAFLPENAKAFISELRKAFFSGSHSTSDFNSKSTIINELKKVSKKFESEVSSSILIFSKWIIKLLESGAKKENLKLSSVLRYFDSLSKPLSELLFNTDLILCDEEEVTAAYTNIINASSKSNQGYLSNRIIAFHQFAATYHVVEPIWSEIPLVKLSVKVSPGFVDEKAYLECLKLVYTAESDGLLSAMLLILAYRFGLRANEVFGILRKDVKDDDELMWVLIRSNHIRVLKSRQSARRVPLCFALSNMEQTIIKRCLAEAEAEFGDEMSKPLFNDQGKPLDRLQKKRLSLQASQMLKLVTGSQHITLHHCRHSAVNRIALAFTKLPLKGWGGEGPLNDLSSFIFGHQQITKRMSWATARYLGHGILETQYRSYIHFLPDLVESRFKALKKAEEKHSLNSKRVIHLSALKQAPKVDYSLLNLMPDRQTIITPLVILRIFKLIGMGKSIDWVAEHMDIPTRRINSIFEVLKKQLSLVTVNNKPVNVRHFFKGFTKPVWDRLTHMVARVDMDESKADLIYSLKSKCGMPSVMIGATRQIVLWNSAHFRIFKVLNALFELSEADYKVFVSVKNNKNLNRYLKLLNLNFQFKQHYQLDAITSKASYIKPRANIVADSISKNAKTSFELVTILLVLLSFIDVIN